MSEHNKPILSDEKILRYASQYVAPTSREIKRACDHVRDTYEAQRTKDRELIQTLVNVLAKTTKWAHSAGRERFMWTEEEAERAMSDEVAALALAGEQGYQPTEK